MHILLMAQHYTPEEVSGAVLATHLAEDLVRRGHRVTFVTCAPNYPSGKVFPSYKNAIFSFDTHNGVRVIRVWSYITPSKNFWPRIFNYGTFSIMAFSGGLLAGKVDVVLNFSPPLPLGLSAWLLSRLKGVPWVLRVEDLYPDAAIAAGVLTNRQAIRFFKSLERFLYRQAARISLISEGFRRLLLEKGVDSSKLSVTPVCTDPNDVHPMPQDNEFRRQYGLTGKFVLLYAGNLGLTSALEDVLDAAVLLKAEEDIKFVIVGEGVKRDALMKYTQQHHLTNVIFLPYQPRKRLSEMMAAADIGLVTLNAASARFSLPGKVFNIMASGRPILAVCPEDSEVSELVGQYDCGINIIPGDANRLGMAVQALKAEPERLAQMGSNGRFALETVFSRQVCVDSYERLLLSLNGTD